MQRESELCGRDSQPNLVVSEGTPRGMQRELEPGFLSIFSMYIVVRMGVILGSAFIYFAWYSCSLDTIPGALCNPFPWWISFS